MIEQALTKVASEKLLCKFYTYLLMRPDGSVFYVGKGQGNRINEHEYEARRGAESYKCRVIRKIWIEGGQILKQKVGFFDREESAYELEIMLISFFGRENLTNATDGGEGGGPTPKYGPREEIHVKVPVDDLAYVRDQGNVTEWVIQAIKEKREREGKQ